MIINRVHGLLEALSGREISPKEKLVDILDEIALKYLRSDEWAAMETRIRKELPMEKKQ